jgi:hypothetical protein
MPELGPSGSVRGARGNSRPYRDSSGLSVKPTRMTQQRHSISRDAYSGQKTSIVGKRGSSVMQSQR